MAQKSNLTENVKYIPALKYAWLTKFYDPIIQLTMPERTFKESLIHAMRIESVHQILDFGCGSLTLSLMAAKMHPDAAFYGVDVDEKILSIAGQKIVATNQHIFIQHYDGIRLPYPDGYFDRVMSSLVFHHLNLAQKYNALNEIHRVLKPSGQIHIADFGRPVNILQRIGFYGVQLLDGFETTRDSLNNTLQRALRETHFFSVEEEGEFKTIVGTVRLVKGIKLKDQT